MFGSTRVFSCARDARAIPAFTAAFSSPAQNRIARLNTAERLSPLAARVKPSNVHYNKEGMTMSENHLVPLGLLALEGYGDGRVETLARILGAEVLIDQTTGLKAVHPNTARRLHDETEHRRARERAARAHAARQPNPTVERVKAIADQQAMMRQTGEIDSETPALAVMLGAEHQAHLARKGRDFDRLKAARGDVVGFGRTFGGIGRGE
jgi:hypothetical protein